MTTHHPYVLGHSARELERLGSQARLVDPITRRFFRDAGIVPGMRVLDVGSGVGHVSFLVADLVGDVGEVVGVDRASPALAVARARAIAEARGNVRFLQGDPAEMAFDGAFDAVVGRYVLMFQPDPAAMLRKLSAHVRRGGVVAFHEVDWDGVESFPPVPRYDQCCRWIVETLRALGTETRMGTKLHATFLAAGLRAPAIRLEAVMGGHGGPNTADAVLLIAGLVETLLPEMERLGIATAADVGVETLVERVCDEMSVGTAVIAGRSEIGAWSTI